MRAVCQAGANPKSSPLAIEIDPSANLYPTAPGSADWVKDSLPNLDAPSLIDSIAVGIIPNVTGAPGGRGHWNGVRIVDGIDGSDDLDASIARLGRRVSLGLGVGGALIGTALLAQSARAPRWAPSVMSAIGVSLAGGLLAEVRRQR